MLVSKFFVSFFLDRSILHVLIFIIVGLNVKVPKESPICVFIPDMFDTP